MEWLENAKGQTPSLYAYDTPKKSGLKETNYPSVKDAKGKTVSKSYKAVLNGSSDSFYAKISLKDAALKDREIAFQTITGRKINAEEIEKSDKERLYRLELKGVYSYEEEEVLAMLMPEKEGDEREPLASFILVHMEPKTVKLSLVPLDEASQGNLSGYAEKLNEIYAPIGVRFEVTQEPILDISGVISGNTIETGSQDLMNTYSEDQKKINALYPRKGGDHYVVFITEKRSSKGLSGYMRLNGRYGYVFGNGNERTLAHEIAHGSFRLEHPKEKSTNLLMDQARKGIVLSYLDWKQIQDPKLKLYSFQGDEEGEEAAVPPKGLIPNEGHGAIYKDHDGSWWYDENNNTWVGMNGTPNLENYVEIEEIVITPKNNQTKSIEEEASSILDLYPIIDMSEKVLSSALGSLVKQFENINSGSNGKLYFRKKTGKIFKGNQYVTTTPLKIKYAKFAKVVKRGGFVSTVLSGGFSIAKAYDEDGRQIGYNTMVALAEFGGGIAGAKIGAELGAEIGFIIGANFAGIGAVPGAMIGGLVGGFLGSFIGDYYGGKMAEEAAKEILKK